MTKYYLWCDLETTGLDTDRDYLLEAAFVLTDTDLKEVSHMSRLYRPEGDWLDKMSRGAFELHTRNNLITDIATQWKNLKKPVIGNEYTGTNFHEGSIEVLEWLYESLGVEVDEGSLWPYLNGRDGSHIVHLAGSTVEFDQKVLSRVMPGLIGVIDYHLLNVSSLRLDLKDTNPEVVQAWMKEKVDGNHRALADIRNSIAELRFYREWRQNGL